MASDSTSSDMFNAQISAAGQETGTIEAKLRDPSELIVRARAVADAPGELRRVQLAAFDEDSNFPKHVHSVIPYERLQSR